MTCERCGRKNGSLDVAGDPERQGTRTIRVVVQRTAAGLYCRACVMAVYRGQAVQRRLDQRADERRGRAGAASASPPIQGRLF